MAREADGLKNVAAETVLPETTVGDGVSVVRGLTLVRMVGVGQVCVVAGAKSAAVVEASAGLGKAETTAASRAYAIVHVRHRRVIDAPMSFFAGMGAKFGDDDSDDGGGIQQR